ncbi:MAG: iron-containing alcohol dehydrogenase [Treponema sp.]|nr:iron-containing alcohol dehydrogenase [Treponema sp.]
MKDFVYNAPTKVIFGRNKENQAGQLIIEYFSTYEKDTKPNVLIVLGGGSAVKSGLLERVSNSLKDFGIKFLSISGVVPNPRISLAREGIELCKKHNINFLLAVGGGSVIDTAKAIGYGVANPEIDVWDIYSGKATAKGCTPIGCILTIAAAGSEMSNSSVMTNEDGWLKRGYNSEYSRCKFAILNPELTMTLPMYQTQSGAVDILMHTLERYFAPERSFVKDNIASNGGIYGGPEGIAELTDGLAESLMKVVIKNARKLMNEPNDYNARAEMMWASSLSHNGLTACGGTGDWSCHQMEHELGGMFDVAHGAGLSALWGTWARYVYADCPSRFAKFAVDVMGVEPVYENGTEDLMKTSLKGIEALEDFFRYIKMPTCIKDLGIEPTNEQIAQMALKCSFYHKRKVGGFHPLDASDMEKIYKAAL